MDKNFEFLIVSPCDLEKLVCEIYYKGKFFAEISQETEEMIIEISTANPLIVPLDTLQKVLENARKHLLGEKFE